MDIDGTIQKADSLSYYKSNGTETFCLVVRGQEQVNHTILELSRLEQT